MKPEIAKLRNEHEEYKRLAAIAEGRLSQVVRECRHEWTAPVADHIYREGYTIPGDPPGTMGVDWRGPCYVEPKTTHRWKRTCRLCGHVEHTSNTNKHVTETPDFGS
jgi:hypothetical protein